MSKIPSLHAISPQRRLAFGAAIGLVVWGLLSLCRGSELFETLELRFVDMRTRHYAGDRDPDERIVIAQVEESDIDWVRRELIQPWPWSLDFNAHIVGVLDEAGAAALMVDVLHLDRGAGPDDVPGETELTPTARNKRLLEAGQAAIYGGALRRFGKAAVGFELAREPRYELEGRRAAALPRLGDVAGFDAGVGTFRRKGAQLPVLRVSESAGRLGFTNAMLDADGIVRRAAVFGRWGDRLVRSLPAATAEMAGQALADTEDGVRVGSKTVQRLQADHSFLVNFRGGGLRRVYPHIAPAQLLSWAMEKEEKGKLPEAARAALAGKIVVFGVNAAGLQDHVATPLGTMEGPTYQATALDNLLHGDGRVRASRGTNALLLLLLVLAVGVLGARLEGRLLPHLPPIVLGIAFAVVTFQRFGNDDRLSLDLFTPLLGILLTWGGALTLRVLTAGRRNRWLEGTFGRYMAPPIIEALKSDPTLLELGGRDAEITVFFSDVANFTRHSAKLEARQIVALLNRYLTAHCAAVMDEGGVVDKFEGDAVMAFFGDPVPQTDHAERACRTALAVIASLPALEPVWREMGLDEFGIRIGLNTGRAVVGNMGSAQRFDYTCMGDTVNLASRIEGAGKIYRTKILVGAATAEAAPACLFKPLGKLVVVGRKKPVAVCELLATRAAADAELVAHAEAFARAMAAVLDDDLDAAAAALTEAEPLRAGDGPCAWLRGVIAALEVGEFKRPWNGVTQQTAK